MGLCYGRYAFNRGLLVLEMKIWVVKKKGDNLVGTRLRCRGESISLEEGLIEISPGALKGQKVAFLHHSQDFYFTREIFPKTNPEILKLQIQDKLQEMGLFEAPPIIRYQIDEEIGNQVEVEIAAVVRREISNLLRFSSQLEVRLEKIIPEELAIAYLSIKETTKFILSAYLTEDRFLIFLTGQGHIHFFRNIEIDPEFGVTESIIEDGLLASLDYCERILGIEIEGMIIYGSQRDLLAKSPIKEFKPSFLFVKNADIETILNFPSFFGAPFVPNTFNFIPESQQIFLRNLNFARYVAYLFLMLAIINYGLWATYSPKIKKLEREIKVLTAEIHKKRGILEETLPEEKRRKIEETNSIIEKYRKSFKLDKFLAFLEDTLPQTAKIVEAKGEEGENSFSFELKTVFEGDLEEIKREIDIFYKNLATSYNLEEKIFNYDEINKEGLLVIKGKKQWQS